MKRIEGVAVLKMALFAHRGRKSIKYVKLITRCFSIAILA